MTATARCSICHIFPVVSPIKAAVTGGICDRCFAELTCPPLAQASKTTRPQLQAYARPDLIHAAKSHSRRQ